MGFNIYAGKIKSKLMLSCKTATELMERQHRERLSIMEQIKLAYHNRICIVCKYYGDQSKLLENLFKEKQAEAAVPDEMAEHSKQLEEKILKQLDSLG